jgi:very-short-patch-repair endonuclease
LARSIPRRCTPAAAQNRIITDASRSADDKKKARRLRAEAESQLALLIEPENVVQADFYTYRYFASEGFLPGYNFPRLPLSAFIPGRRQKQGRDEFVSRPRFLAISEFGPRAILYHEGARYLINRVILTSQREGENDEIVTARAKLCASCGYLHDRFAEGTDGPDLCERCGVALGAPMSSLFRLQNVSTRRRDKISSDEEERLRVGYELKTGVRFESRSGRISARGAQVLSGDEPLAELIYGDAARLWRINLGWRRRARPEDIGFDLDVERGYWARSQQEQDDSEDPLSNRRRRVVPYVEDHRNCLLVEPAHSLETAEMATLQAALKHAIQSEFQLEDMELAAEPLPSQAERRQILLYESAEGGAGVLRRLLDDPTALASVARAALVRCHFDPDTGEDLRRPPGAKEDCEAACYDCLMSYTNQPDHRLLDRQLVRTLLLELGGGRVEVAPASQPRGEHLAALMRTCETALERRWLQFLEDRDLNLPSHAQRRIDICNTRPDFLYSGHHAAVYVDGPHHEYPERTERDREQNTRMEDAGYVVVRFGAADDWGAIVSRLPSVFGAVRGSGQ